MSKITQFRFHLGYFCIAILLLLVEIMIAKYMSGWIRGYLGDILVIMLIYSALITVLDINKTLVVLFTLIVAFIIEFSQYFKLAELLGFEKGSLAYIVLGNTFSVEDLVCYVVGGCIVLIVEHIVNSF